MLKRMAAGYREYRRFRRDDPQASSISDDFQNPHKIGGGQTDRARILPVRLFAGMGAISHWE
jgi:hypothetical protein